MALNEEQKTMVEIRKMVVKNLKESVEQNEVNNALNYVALLNEIPSYVDGKE